MRELHSENANLAIYLTQSRIITEVREPQPRNAPEPMDVTEFGMVTEVRNW